MCSNLRNKEYYVENKKATKEEFEKFRSMLSSYSRLRSAKERFEKLKIEYPQKYIHEVQTENVIGDYLTNCKNCDYCFDSPNLWDCKYVFQAFGGLKNSMDIQECGEAERCFESAFSGYNSQTLFFTVHCIGGQSDLYYCTHCPHSNHLFGCVGARKMEYCIFNKQYSREEYENMVAKIIEHMQKTNEWGEFFPVDLSIYDYNDSLAADYFPMNKEEVIAHGWSWHDEEDQTEKYMGPAVEVPDNINDVDDDICNKILQCETTGKLFKIIPQELALYRKMQLPLRRKCFIERHRERFASRNPRKLYDRKCEKCNAPFQTTYALERPEKIYCEKCYLDSFE